MISSSPEKLGRSSKSRTKSPCSPQAVGDAVADSEVPLDVEVEAVLPELVLPVVKTEFDVVDEKPEVVLSEPVLSAEVEASEELDAVDDESEAWPFAREEAIWVLDVAEPRLEDVGITGPLARELPLDDNPSVLGETELNFVTAVPGERMEVLTLPVELLWMVVKELAVNADAVDVLGDSSTEVPLPLLRGAELLEVAGGEYSEDERNVSAPLVDAGAKSDCVAITLRVDMLLKIADVAPVGTPVTPCTPVPVDRSAVVDDAETSPLMAVVEPEAGEIPSVLGIVVGNADVLVPPVVIEIRLPSNEAVLLLAEDDLEVADPAGMRPLTSKGTDWYSVVVMTLVLVEYVWPPDEAQKNEIVAVVGVARSAAALTVLVLGKVCEFVIFQPELPTPPKDDLVVVVSNGIVLVRVVRIVLVKSTVEVLVEVGIEGSAGGVTVVVWVRVVCEVVVDVFRGLTGSLGVTKIVVVAVVKDAPLDGETPFIQAVEPELTEKTKG